MTTTPQTGDKVRVTYEATLGWRAGNTARSPGVVLLGTFGGRDLFIQEGKYRKIVSVEVVTEADPGPAGVTVQDTFGGRHDYPTGTVWQWSGDGTVLAVAAGSDLLGEHPANTVRSVSRSAAQS